MATIYSSGKYLEVTKTWHIEDSPWKAAKISKIMADNNVHPLTIAEIGCGAGAILDALSNNASLSNADFEGYDISSHAIELAKNRKSKKIRFFCKDMLSETNTDRFDVLLAIDVFEHVPDYMGFLDNCRRRAHYKIYHVPLDIHVSSVLRNAFIGNRYTIGHLHYFTADSAIATLRDTGHEIVDYFYTSAATELFKQHPSIKKAIANVPRLICSKLNLSFTARIFGGHSLLVLTK